MSEMLGNRHLLALRFADAIPHFEASLHRHPEDDGTIRKLLFCHALLGHRDEVRGLLPDLTRARTPQACLPKGPVAGSPAIPVELRDEVRAHADELGPGRVHLALALASEDTRTATRELDFVPVDSAEADWRREILEAVQTERKATDANTN
ncbi:MAG: hypothetical protein R3E12_05565 [Candidatus Eisenbacteria bacterium]|uniref:Tetratricopeptide repeat protein n=1 Tax=Eiseniibacteriota bacterium TaxID=2212470 RepID=A0A956LXM0_UNCEI|nr:hypothetical protein [Candidatus Eisenbacteria bacterium]